MKHINTILFSLILALASGAETSTRGLELLA